MVVSGIFFRAVIFALTEMNLPPIEGEMENRSVFDLRAPNEYGGFIGVDCVERRYWTAVHQKTIGFIFPFNDSLRKDAFALE